VPVQDRDLLTPLKIIRYVDRVINKYNVETLSETMSLHNMKHHAARFVLLALAISSTHAQIAPACSGSKCYLCSKGEATAILNGDACSCSDGTVCELVQQGAPSSVVMPMIPTNMMGGGGRCGNVDLIGFCEDECGSGDGAQCINDSPVCACGPSQSSSSASSDTDGECRQSGEGQGGSRCGRVDLIGFCEDKCGSGDGACCVRNEDNEWIPKCACSAT